jgi:aminocarboxymuconate-semialdehyde decarboxylase
MTDITLASADLHRMGVTHALYSSPPFTILNELSPDVGAAWSAIFNNALADTIAGHAGAYGLAMVPLQDPPAAAAELRRAVASLGFRGAEIPSNINGVELDDPHLDPFYAAAQDLDAPILIHPHYVAGANRMKEYYLRNLVGNPLDTTLAACRLVMGGVFDRFPGLKFCLSHAGGYFLAGLGRLDHGWRVNAGARSRCARPPSAYLPNLYFDTIAHSAPWLRYVVEQAGVDHVLLGTDLPFDMGDEDPVATVTGLGLDAAATAAILGDTAARIFRL